MAAAGVPGWVWCVDLGLALFPLSISLRFPHSVLMEDLEGKRAEGERPQVVGFASRFVRVGAGFGTVCGLR